MASPANRFPAYHAHVYFDAQTLDHARELCERTRDRFGIEMGRVHEKLVGPHPEWSCQLAFSNNQFDGVVGFLDQGRQGLTILVHGLSDDVIADHTDGAAWLGEPATLNIDFLRRLVAAHQNKSA